MVVKVFLINRLYTHNGPVAGVCITSRPNESLIILFSPCNLSIKIPSGSFR